MVVGGNPVTRDPVTQWILDLVVLVFGGSMDLVSGGPSAIMVVVALVPVALLTLVVGGLSGLVAQAP